MVRAKFYVTKVEHHIEGGGAVTLEPVYCGSAENEDFFKWTPAGLIEMSTINPGAFERFEEGAEFYIDFTPAGKE